MEKVVNQNELKIKTMSHFARYWPNFHLDTKLPHDQLLDKMCRVTLEILGSEAEFIKELAQDKLIECMCDLVNENL